jgi:hypothetical protein
MGMPLPAKPVKPTRTVKDIEDDANAAKIDEKTKLNTLKDLTVWIHDDSVTGDLSISNSLGVFNPIAERMVCSESKQYKSHVVYGAPIRRLLIRSRFKILHLFPMDVLGMGPEGCRYL